MTATLFMFLVDGLHTERFATMEFCEAAIERLVAQIGDELAIVSACISTGFTS